MKIKHNLVGKNIQANRPNIQAGKSLAITGMMNVIEGKKHDDGKQDLPTFSMLAYTGEVIEQYFGKTIVDLEGVQVQDTIPILYHHDTSIPVGHSTKISVTAKGIQIDGVISGDPEDADVRRVIAMGKNGFPWQASIGASIESVEFNESDEPITVNGREIKGDIAIVRKSKLYESSILPLGADGNTDTKIAANKQILEKIDMGFDAWLKANGFDKTTLDKKVLASLEKTYNKEVALEASIEDMGNKLGNTNEDQAKQLGDVKAEIVEMKRIEAVKTACGDNVTLAKKAVDDNWDISMVNASLAEIKAMHEAMPAPAVHVKGGVTSDKIIEASAHLCMGIKEEDVKVGLTDEEMNQATDLKLYGFSDLASTLLAAKGTFKVGMHREEMLQLAFSTTSLPGILGNAGNKSLRAAYNITPEKVSQVSTAKQVKDFKVNTIYQLARNLVFKQLGELGEIQHGDVGESNYTVQIDQYAIQYVLGRKTLINDDLGAFAELFAGFGQGASTAYQRNFWKTFVDNGGSFYTGQTLTSSPLNIDTLTAAFAKLEEAVDGNGDPINVLGTTGKANLVVPPGLRVVAQQLAKETRINETTTDNKGKPANNPHAGMLNVVDEAYLNNANVAGGSATTWYLQATGIDTFVDAKLQGNLVPSMRSALLPVGTLGIANDGVFDFGASTVDQKGIVKNTA